MVQDRPEVQPGVVPGAEKTEPPTYTQEQVDKMVTDARTATFADVKRLQVEADKTLKRANAASERLAQLQKDMENAELEAARDEPETLKRIRAEQARKQAESDLEKARLDLDETNARLSEVTAQQLGANREKLVHDIASKLTVDPAILGKLAKFTDGKAESIEEIASSLPKVQTQQTSSMRPDSNRSRGGATKTKLQIQQDYVSGKLHMTAEQYQKELAAIGERP